MLVAASALLAISAVCQTRSYWRDPYFDTNTTVARALHAVVRPGDIVVANDFIIRSTLTVTRPLSTPVLLLTDVEKTDLGKAPRLVFLESINNRPQRTEIAARIAARGYPNLQEWPVPAGDGSGPLSDWRILTFARL